MILTNSSSLTILLGESNEIHIDEDNFSAISTNVLIGLPISSNKQTNIVVAFIIARNSKGNEKKVIIAKKIRVV